MVLLLLLEVLVQVAVIGGGDHPAALDPVARVGDQVVRIVLAELI
jgi:hypothetical protein